MSSDNSQTRIGICFLNFRPPVTEQMFCRIAVFHPAKITHIHKFHLGTNCFFRLEIQKFFYINTIRIIRAFPIFSRSLSETVITTAASCQIFFSQFIIFATSSCMNGRRIAENCFAYAPYTSCSILVRNNYGNFMFSRNRRPHITRFNVNTIIPSFCNLIGKKRKHVAVVVRIP